MERANKDLQIGEIKGRFDKMTAAVLLDFKGMTVESATKLRAQFRSAGVEYKVVKNTLVKQKPSTAKGTYLRSITVSSTMGPGVKIDPTAFMGGTEEA